MNNERMHSLRRARRLLTSLMLGAMLSTVWLTSSTAHAFSFPRVKVLEPNVRFWRNVYAVWSVNDIAFHDDQDFRIVYKVVRVPARGKRVKGQTRRQVIQKTKAEILKALTSLAKKNPKSSTGLLGLEKEIFDRLKAVKRADKYKRVKHLRAQNDLRERFRSGYIRAGEFEPEVRAYLKRAGLPEEIVALAYVESLMTVRAVSHAGAQGIWQFMPATGREYMQVHRALDERHDPVLATIAAAKYLNTARKKVGPWPVAITSYNYGRSGVRRLITQAGSNDLGVILKKAKASRFKIAARNYYASFIAVTDVLKAPQKYFPGAKQRRQWRYDVLRLPFPMTATQIVAQSSISATALQHFNPSLTKKTRRGEALLPTGFPLRVAKGSKAAVVKALVAMTRKDRVAALSTVGKKHKANGKDTVAKIAKRYRVEAQDVADLNGVTTTFIPKKRARVAIPQKPIRFSMLPGAKSVGIPAAPALKNVRLAKAILPKTTPSKAKVVKKAKRKARRKKRKPERVKVTLVSVVKVIDDVELGAVDVISGDPRVVPEVDMVVGTDGAQRFLPVTSQPKALRPGELRPSKLRKNEDENANADRPTS